MLFRSRAGRNPQTGATIQLAASAAPVFRPGAGFRSLVTRNGSSAKQAVEPAPIADADAAPKKKPGKKAAAETGKNGKKAKKASAKASGKDSKKAAKKAR